MGTGSVSGSGTKTLLRWFVLLLLSKLISCYSYPLFGGRRYLRPLPIRRSSYFPFPTTHHRSDYQLPDYDDEFMVSPQEEYEYNAYDKYPYVQYFGYYPGKDYYRDKTARGIDGYEYFDDRVPQSSEEEELSGEVAKEGIYPYGQETWYEEELPRYDSNAQANAAFLQNLIMAQMYQDAKNQHPFGYGSAADDYDDQHWFYGVPTTEVEEKEKVKQYFKNKEDEEVRELESLARKKSKSKKLKEKDPYKKQKMPEVIEKPTKPKSKMTEDEYFDLQKQIILSGRKNSFVPVAEGLRLSKKQTYDPVDVKNNFWNFHNSKTWPGYSEVATNSIKKLNANRNIKSAKDSGVSDSKIKVQTPAAAAADAAATAPTVASSTPIPQRPPTTGQKEVVLPRPSNPVQRPFSEISSRSLHQPSVYDTIRKMLDKDDDVQQGEIPQPQKRFVLTEDQLTSELSGLKKLSA